MPNTPLQNPGGTGGDTARGKRVQKRSLDCVDDEKPAETADASECELVVSRVQLSFRQCQK